jgi:hypothetical protein
MMIRTRILQRCTRVKFSLFRCTSADSFFSCCDIVAAPRQRPGHYDQVPARNNERYRGHRLRRTKRFQRCIRATFTLFRCASAEKFFSCCDSVAEPRQRRPGRRDQVPEKTTSGAAGIGLGTTIKYPRRAKGAVSGNTGVSTTLNYLRRAAGNGRAQR